MICAPLLPFVQGHCDRSTGLCQCLPGFEGFACQFMQCAGADKGRDKVCSGHGQCRSLREAGREINGHSLTKTFRYEDPWDADRIRGCVCDFGFEGYDCSRRSCPHGDDPLTLDQEDELQLLTCACQGNCTGFFYLTFKGHTTGRIAHDAVLSKADERRDTRQPGLGEGESLESKLAELRTLDGVIAFPRFEADEAIEGGPRVCRPESDGGGAETYILFNEHGGNVPPLEVRSQVNGRDSDGSIQPANVNLFHGGPKGTRDGTTEFAECSNRGLCDHRSGVCFCHAFFGSSDGDGNEGDRPDCGHPLKTITACPNALEICSDRGICDNQIVEDGRLVTVNVTEEPFANMTFEFTCDCHRGFFGSDCSQQRCPVGNAWFDEPSGENLAHQPAECSNRGLCDTALGRCQCQPGFEGDACDRLACPKGSNGEVCSGRGRCLSLKDLAPRGRQHGWPRGLPEVQEVTCALEPLNIEFNATAGEPEPQRQTFIFEFRHQRSAPLTVDATERQVRDALEDMASIGFVDVRFDIGDMVCSSEGTVARITFETDPGDLPQLQVFANPPGGELFVETIRNGSLVSYGATQQDPDTWDAEQIFGCFCDGYPDSNKTIRGEASATYETTKGRSFTGYLGGGLESEGDVGLFEGPTCQLRPCPYGADPLEEDLGEDEVQLVTCALDPESDMELGAEVILSHMTESTAPLPLDSSAEDVKIALEMLPSVGVVDVTIRSNVTDEFGLEFGRLCELPSENYTEGAETTISFRTELGDLPEIRVSLTAGLFSEVSSSTIRNGTRTNIECSGRGRCDTSTGLCHCFSGFVSGSGNGTRGRRGDCGAQDALFVSTLEPNKFQRRRQFP